MAFPSGRARSGRPALWRSLVEDPLRNVAFQASTLHTSLYTSVRAFNVADLVVGLGLGCWIAAVPLAGGP